MGRLSVDSLGMTSTLDFHGSRLRDTNWSDVSMTCHTNPKHQRVQILIGFSRVLVINNWPMGRVWALLALEVVPRLP